MCNCLDIPCKICGLSLPVHLGDWKTEPEEIECYCKGHIPPTNVTIFVLKEGQDRHFRKGWKMGIRALTDNAKKNKELNHPNLGVDWVEVDVPGR